MRSILITGGTGSFGRAFARRALDAGCERVCILSRGEHAQAAMREAFDDDGRLRWFIGDVRDGERLRRAFEDVEVVVHAAALKRIEVGAYNPMEMVKTNVLGAMNVIEAAQDARVKRVVALSTDKAYQPVSAYGHSKAMMESLFLAANNQQPGDRSRRVQFAVTRYGNVAGSAGSVIPRWREILRTSDTVPVTDPSCTRFWMTMDEACDLVERAIAIMPAELMIPSLPAFRLGDLAEAMGARMQVTGLPDWEKRHESLQHGRCSADAPRLGVEELRQRLVVV